jgi:predicted SprT family Zn-dependent metalloprotease
MQNKRIDKALAKIIAPRPIQQIQKKSEHVPSSRELIACILCGKQQRKDNLKDKGESGLCNKCIKERNNPIQGRNKYGQAIYLCFVCGKE